MLDLHRKVSILKIKTESSWNSNKMQRNLLIIISFVKPKYFFPKLDIKELSDNKLL